MELTSGRVPGPVTEWLRVILWVNVDAAVPKADWVPLP